MKADMYNFGSCSFKGRRAKNEDACFFSAFEENPASLNGVICAADGMGGMEGGEVASALAAEAWEKFVSEELTHHLLQDQGLKEMVGRGVDLVNSAILEYVRQHAELKGMGSTLVSVLFYTDKIVSVNIGDSRAYTVTNDTAQLHTEDHNAFEEALKKGLLQRIDGDHHPYRNALTRYLGEEPGFQADIRIHPPLAENEILLVCTDGLSKHMENYQLQLEIGEGSTLQQSVENLCNAAYLNGSDDNITAVAVETTARSRARKGTRVVQLPPPGQAGAGPDQHGSTSNMRNWALGIGAAAIGLIILGQLPPASKPSELSLIPRNVAGIQEPVSHVSIPVPVSIHGRAGRVTLEKDAAKNMVTPNDENKGLSSADTLRPELRESVRVRPIQPLPLLQSDTAAERRMIKDIDAGFTPSTPAAPARPERTSTGAEVR